MSTDALWYAARGTGTAMLVLFTVSLVLGILTRGGKALPGLPRFAVAGLHRNTGLLAVTFLAVHVVTIVSDHYARTGWLAVVVPFTGHYRPLWVGLGAVAFDCFVAVVVTSLLRRRIGLRVYRGVHWASYAAWPAAVLHGIFAGTDDATPWMIATDVVAIAAVLAAVLWRLSDSPRWKRAAAREPLPVATR